MSTRAVIGRANGDTWEGRYHHFDGYPTGLGARLYEVWHQTGGAVLTLLVDEHPAGWSTILGCDITAAPGYQSGEVTAGMSLEERQEYERTHGPQCYCHGERHDPDWLITPDMETWCEWAYIINEQTQTMVVFKEAGSGGVVRWVPISSVALDGPEPDWNLIEQMGDRLP